MSDEIGARGEQTQKDILQSALELFLNHGYHGTSMRRIAQQAGIALGGIYNHFSSKEDLFVKILIENHPYRRAIPAMQQAQGNSLDELVQDAARRMVAVLGPDLAFVKLLFIEAVEFNGQHIPILFEIIYPEVLAFVEGFIGGRPELRSIPTPILLRVYIGLFLSYVLTEDLLARQMPPEMVHNDLDYFIDIFLHGVLVRPDHTDATE